MSTYNGEKYLEEQIESLIRQKGVEFSILVRDDGSTDNTKVILEKYQNQGVLNWYSGGNIKTAHSFFDLLRNSNDSDYYAFCDQDDVWDENKLFVAIEMLNKYSNLNKPSMYFSKAQLVDENLNIIESKDYPKGKYTFGTALIRNNATGCTMVINKALREKVNMYTPQYVLMHDHWIYLLCLSLNGDVVYDPTSFIKYRQHKDNLCGANNSLKKRIKKSGVFNNDRIRYNMALQLYKNYHDLLPYENAILLQKVINYPKSKKEKWSLILDRKIKSNSLISDISVILSIINETL